ncbi:hypothetical protein FRB99_004235 [Tulasnella sp. 403]|nr:hypothetical protein FRB99_004235 [Tulasnella sp. 403]
MTTLKSFQSEIEEIARKHLHPPSKGHASTEDVLSESGANAGPTTHSAGGPSPTSPKVPTSPTKATAAKIKGKTIEVEAEKSNEPLPRLQRPVDMANELLESLQTLLGDDTTFAQARDVLAQILLDTKGEIVLPLGLHPPLNQIWTSGNKVVDVPLDSVSPTEEGWRGQRLSDEELAQTMRRLQAAIEDLGGFNTTLFHHVNPSRSLHLLRLPRTSVEATVEVRVAVVGNVDSGKSTTLGVLTRGALDDGRGKARVGLFRHKHEIETGRTSSVGMEILGFSADGLPIYPSYHIGTTEANTGFDTTAFAPATARREKLGWDEISVKSSRIVSFSDLAGHERYLKTSLFGLTSGAPDCILLMVGGNAGMIGMSKEHLAVALALSVPVVVAITKIDMTPVNVLEETKKQVQKILRSPGCRKTPVFVQNQEMAVEISQVFTENKSVCPIFLLSNVTGEGLELFRTFLNLIPSSEGDQTKYPVDQPLEYSITEIWSVPHVGTVVNGLIASGRIKVGDPVLFGPDSTGTYQSSVVRSIQRKRASVNSAEAGQCVSIALKRVRRAAVRKGMVLVAKTDSPPQGKSPFTNSLLWTSNQQGQVLILYHNSTLQRNYQAMLHCGAIRQTVRILGMDNPKGILRTGDRATVEFEFMSHPEFIKAGMKLLFREGKTKARLGGGHSYIALNYTQILSGDISEEMSDIL